MKKLTLTITIAAVLGAVFLVLAFPVSAAKPEPVTFTLDMCYDSVGFAFGPFDVDIGDDGSIHDAGFGGGEFSMASGTVHAKWLLEGEWGNMLMRFNASVIPDSDGDQVIGHFVIVSGTDDYAGLHGQGSIDLRLTDTPCTPEKPYNLTGTYSGVALYAPPDGD